MPLTFSLRLEERLPDRVVVSAELTPEGGPVKVDGVAVELYSCHRVSLSPRVLLPVSGLLTGAVTVRAELRNDEEGGVPIGAVVVGTAWAEGQEPCRLLCPADPFTELETHLRGTRCIGLGRKEVDLDDDLATLDRNEKAALAVTFPWIQRQRCRPCGNAVQTQPTPIAKELDCPECGREPEAELDEVDEISEEYGLCAEDAAFLKQLLEES